MSLAQTNTFPSSGNVGIGTTSPSSFGTSQPTLDLRGSSVYRTGAIKGISSDLSRGWSIGRADDSSLPDGLVISTSDVAPINFRTGGNTRLTIDSTGFIGIGNLNPGSQLNVGTKTTNSPSSIAQFGGYVPDGEARVLSLVNSGGGSDQSTSIDFHNRSVWSSTGRIQLQQLGTGTASKMNFYTFSGSLKNQMTLNENGSLGIGTSSPASKLEIVCTGEGAELLRLSTERPWVFRQTSTGSTSQLDLHSTVSGKNFKISSSNNNRAAQFLVSDNTNGSRVFLVPDGGNVSIGSTDFGSHKLAVDGTIGAREIKVESGTWSDFVFNENYNLRTLEATEQYISENNHLPDIPSESEVKENGINLGEMDARLLQKIEELTLYMIEMNKSMVELKARNEQLEKKFAALDVGK